QVDPLGQRLLCHALDVEVDAQTDVVALDRGLAAEGALDPPRRVDLQLGDLGLAPALGFTSGMLIDLFLPTPLGLSALVFTLVGYWVGVANTGVLRSAWYIPVLTAAAASVAGVVLYAAIGSMLGERMINGHLATIAAVVGLSNAVLAPVGVKLVDWSWGSLRDHRPLQAGAPLNS
ncbi:MAG TPA: hypothetical protein VHF91_09205, partial [Acidimicrobiales bacterium]|nr:hypothetical protein [Acidimicrobiales bacterium]